VFLPKIIQAFKENNVEVRVEKSAIESFNLQDVDVANDADWTTEYSDLTISIKVVDSLEEAIEHINTYGSGHTECIVTEDKAAFEKFFAEVNSAGVYHNASTRFADGFRYGFGAEVGISTGKLHPRGPVGVEGIITYKYKLVGKGQIVADYSGENPRQFTHKDLNK
jgi:glutamate-5-semialdehyde dehydrogenase